MRSSWAYRKPLRQTFRKQARRRCVHTGFTHRPESARYSRCYSRGDCLEEFARELERELLRYLPRAFPRNVAWGSKKYRGAADIFPDGNEAFTGGSKRLRAYQRRWKAIVELRWSA